MCMCKREGEWGAGWKDSLIPRPLPGEKSLGTRLGGGGGRGRDRQTDGQTDRGRQTRDNQTHKEATDGQHASENLVECLL